MAARLSVIFLTLVWLLPPVPVGAALLWSDSAAVLVHDSGPGRDLLDGALKRDDSARDTLYFRFHVAPLSDATTEEYFAAFELFDGDTERLGVGNALGAYAYSAFFPSRASETPNPAGEYVDLRSSSAEPSAPGSVSSYELPHRGQERTIVFKVQYVPNGDDLVTVWLNPDLSAGATELHQPETITTRFSANASFDEVRLRHGGRGEGWVFSDLAIATSFADFVDPGRALTPTVDSDRFFDLQPLEVDTWVREPGMPHASIGALAQTTDGYLWLAGTNQLARFDGVRFVAVSLPEPMHDGTITALLGDSHGTLWIGTDAHGLVRYSHNQFETLTANPGQPVPGVTAIAPGKDAQLWVGTTQGVFSSDQHGHGLRRVAGLELLDGCEIRNLCEDNSGVLWLVAAGKGVFQFQNGGVSQLADARVETVLQQAQCVLPEPNGKLWIGAGDGLVLCREGADWHRYRLPRQSAASPVRVLAATPDGTVWAGSTNDGLVPFKHGKLTALNTTRGSLEDRPAALMVDRDGHLWVGGDSSVGLLRRKPCVALGQSEDLGPGPVTGLAEVAPGMIWVAQPGRGLCRWEGDGFRRLKVAGVFSDDSTVGAMLVTRDHACWLAATNGLLLLRDPQAVSDEAVLFELPGVTITALAEATNHAIWAGTREGQLWRLEQGRWLMERRLACTSPITVLQTEPSGRLWVGTEAAGLYEIDDSICSHFDKKNGLTSDCVWTLHLDANGVLWAGTGGGLVAVSNQVCLTFPPNLSLPPGAVRGILEDSLGRLWLSQEGGLTCIAKPLRPSSALELETVCRLDTTRADDSPTPADPTPVFSQLRDSAVGRLWFASGAGISVVEPRETPRHDAPPPLVLEEVLVDGAPVPGFQPIVALPRPPADHSITPTTLRLAAGHHRLDLRYTCAQFGSPEKLRFRYRLRSLDHEWVEAGSARVAQYSYVPPGEYSFTVELRQLDGRLQDAQIGLSVPPEVWQRPWVMASAGVVLLAGIGGGVRLAENRRMKRRLHRLEQQNLLDRERMRIAQDLHDEMGAKLCRISFLSEHAKGFEPGSRQVIEHVATIARDSRELAHSLDEIVWAVNPHNDTLEHVGSYIGQYAQEYFQGTGIECILEVAPDLPGVAMSSQLRHHLFLAVHEALTNVLKHSQGTQVKIAVGCLNGELRIRVADNGRGFAQPAAHTGSHNGEDSGNGLGNMRERIHSVGGRSVATSAPGQGTTIEFYLPLALARARTKP